MNHFASGLALLAIFAQAKAFAGEITVSAAASLTDAFKQIAQKFEASKPNSKVALNFGASGALLQQIGNGAPVDVFASADQETMDRAQEQALVRGNARWNFVSNTLVVVVPPDSQTPIHTLEDLALASVRRVAIGAPASVPVGRYTQRALERAKLWRMIEPKMIRTQNVRQSLDYVARGEVDAGFVYGSDAQWMKGRVKLAFTVPITEPISYPIALVSTSTNPTEAKQFVEFVRSPIGQSILAKFGFGKL